MAERRRIKAVRRAAQIGVQTMRKVLVEKRKLAQYFGVSKRTIQRISANPMMIREAARENWRFDSGCSGVMAEVEAELGKRCAPGCVRARAWMLAFVPPQFINDGEIQRVIAGTPTWLKPASISKKWKVSKKTLYRHLSAEASSRADLIASMCLVGSDLFRIEDIDEIYLRRSDLLR